MALSKRQIEKLIQSVSATREDELTCDECMHEMARFAEDSLTGMSVQQGQAAVKHHLEICYECREEFEALLKSLSE